MLVIDGNRFELTLYLFETFLWMFGGGGRSITDLNHPLIVSKYSYGYFVGVVNP